MKLPPSLLSLLDSPFFVFSEEGEFLRALPEGTSEQEKDKIRELAQRGLPPATSGIALAAMFGINAGLIRSFTRRPAQHYRVFSIPKGKGKREIHAPRVALKIVQKWFSVQFSKCYEVPAHVYGFVPGRSHVMAAMQHAGAKWVFSVDIKDFFQTTPKSLVISYLQELGYEQKGAELIASLCCYKGFLAQGAPSSPVFSNLCFRDIDSKLLEIAEKYNARVTRYADDIVFSGTSHFRSMIKDHVLKVFEKTPWKLAEHKIELAVSPKERLKVHGLLVHREKVRLTKGYRNRIRGFKHALAAGKVNPDDLARLKGHINYASMVDKIAGLET